MWLSSHRATRHDSKALAGCQPLQSDRRLASKGPADGSSTLVWQSGKQASRTASKSSSKAAPRDASAETTRQAAGAKPTKARTSEQVVLLSGGNPQIAKGEGDAPVQAYIAAMPGWKRDVGRRLDALIVQTLPKVRKAVKWNTPFYGIEGGEGWFLSFHCFTKYVKVTFFRGTSLRPVPPGASKHAEVRYADVYEGALDEAQMQAWVKQAAALPGEVL
jgi:hypothetical protein